MQARRTLAAAGTPFPARSQKFGSNPKRQRDSGHMLTRSGRIAVRTLFYIGLTFFCGSEDRDEHGRFPV